MASPTTYRAAESVAIIGMRGRFPGARDLDSSGRICATGSSRSPVFPGRSPSGLGRPRVGDARRLPAFVQAGAVLDDVDLFDAELLRFQRARRRVIDPQQRLFLECAWESLEDAGYDPDDLPGTRSASSAAAS